MKPGDTFGMWTFNKETTAGKFAMQTWEPRRARQQATMAAAFISGLNYEHSSDLKDVTQRLKSIIHAVSNVTVFIVSDGDAPMKGTPFDKSINAEYKRQRRDRSSSKRPFVTTLIARDGWIIDQSVTIAGNRIDLPPRPDPSAPTAPAHAASGVTNPVVASPVVQAPPLVVAKPAIPEAKPAPKIVILTKPPVATPPVAEPATSTAPATSIANANPPTVPPVPAIPTPAPSAPETKPAEIATQESILAAANAGTTSRAPQAEPATTVTATPPTAIPATTRTAPEQSARTIATTSTAPNSGALAVSSSVIDSALAKFRPEPLSVAARETTEPAEAATAQPPATLQGMGLPGQSNSSPLWMIAFGGIMLAAALLLTAAVLRRGRPAAGASLITRSMDRH